MKYQETLEALNNDILPALPDSDGILGFSMDSQTIILLAYTLITNIIWCRHYKAVKRLPKVNQSEYDILYGLYLFWPLLIFALPALPFLLYVGYCKWRSP